MNNSKNCKKNGVSVVKSHLIVLGLYVVQFLKIKFFQCLPIFRISRGPYMLLVPQNQTKTAEFRDGPLRL